MRQAPRKPDDGRSGSNSPAKAHRNSNSSEHPHVAVPETTTGCNTLPKLKCVGGSAFIGGDSTTCLGKI